MSEKNNKKKKANGGAIILAIVVIVIVIIVAIVIKSTNKTETEGNTVAVTDGTEENELGDYETMLEDGSKQNTSSALAETKTLNGLEITNNQLIYSNGIATLLADVTNTTDSTIEKQIVNFDILDDEGNVLMTVRGIIGEVAAGETITLNMNVSADIANAYNFTIYE